MASNISVELTAKLNAEYKTKCDRRLDSLNDLLIKQTKRTFLGRGNRPEDAALFGNFNSHLHYLIQDNVFQSALQKTFKVKSKVTKFLYAAAACREAGIAYCELSAADAYYELLSRAKTLEDIPAITIFRNDNGESVHAAVALEVEREPDGSRTPKEKFKTQYDTNIYVDPWLIRISNLFGQFTELRKFYPNILPDTGFWDELHFEKITLKVAQNRLPADIAEARAKFKKAWKNVLETTPIPYHSNSISRGNGNYITITPDGKKHLVSTLVDFTQALYPLCHEYWRLCSIAVNASKQSVQVAASQSPEKKEITDEKESVNNIDHKYEVDRLEQYLDYLFRFPDNTFNPNDLLTLENEGRFPLKGALPATLAYLARNKSPFMKKFFDADSTLRIKLLVRAAELAKKIPADDSRNLFTRQPQEPIKDFLLKNILITLINLIEKNKKAIPAQTLEKLIPEALMKEIMALQQTRQSNISVPKQAVQGGAQQSSQKSDVKVTNDVKPVLPSFDVKRGANGSNGASVLSDVGDENKVSKDSASNDAAKKDVQKVSVSAKKD